MVLPKKVKLYCGDTLGGGGRGSSWDKGWKAWGELVATGKRRKCRGKTEQGQQPKCNTSNDVSISEVWPGPDHDSKTLIHVFALRHWRFAEPHSQLAPWAAPCMLHPSPGGCMVRWNSKDCAKKKHVGMFCLFIFYLYPKWKRSLSRQRYSQKQMKDISAHASNTYKLILLFVLYRLNNKLNVQVTKHTNIVVPNGVVGPYCCFCGYKEWKWLDFHFCPLCLYEHFGMGITLRTFVSSLLKGYLFTRV